MEDSQGHAVPNKVGLNLYCGQRSLLLRWLPLHHGVTAACLSRDNHLLLAGVTRIQEVRLEQEEDKVIMHNRGYGWNNRWDKRQMRQLDLGDKQMLDPVVNMRETGSMDVVAKTRSVELRHFLSSSYIFIFQVWLLAPLSTLRPSEKRK